MRVESVVLEDHGDVAVFRRNISDVTVPDKDAAIVDLFKAGEHAKAGGLTATGGADKYEEFAVFYVKAELVDSGDC
jgi:hypothetical protein